jgi:alpha-1,2-mannosyltransferase
MIGKLLTPKRLNLWTMAGQHGCFAVVPVIATAGICYFAVKANSFAIDFHYAFWPAGRHVLLGETPYVGPHSPLASSGVAFVYPAVGALFFAALALIPHTPADILFVLASVGAVVGTLRVLGVRDWRLYGLALLWPAVISGWQTANVTLLMTFGIALAWRHRDRPAVTGLLVALLVSLKVFLWPLLLWLLATRRLAGLAWAIVGGIALNGVAWAVLGFDQLHAYLALARTVTRVEESTAYTPIAVALHLGASRFVAHAVAFAIAAFVAAACLRYGRRRDDSSALLLAIAVSLLATPTVWRHYFALLLVPLAISRPRLSPVWLVPLALFPCPVTSPVLWQLLLTLGAMTCVITTLLLGPSLRIPNFSLDLRRRMASP